jgi:Icc-related predicted phosphoesterase
MHRDGGAEFLNGLPPAEGTVDTLGEDGVDAVALVGDICAFSQLPDVLQWFCDHYADILYVWGNHECYGHTISAVRELALALQDKFSNLHVLDNTRCQTSTGTSFIGGTLWYRDDPGNAKLEHQLNDFYKIKNLRNEVYKENAKTIAFLQEEIQERDIVLTHYLPSPMSIAEKYEGDPFNCFFLCDMEDVMKEKQPKLWLHGHTHDSFDYTIFRTQVVCNPLGYPHEPNPAFHPLILDV